MLVTAAKQNSFSSENEYIFLFLSNSSFLHICELLRHWNLASDFKKIQAVCCVSQWRRDMSWCMHHMDRLMTSKTRHRQKLRDSTFWSVAMAGYPTSACEEVSLGQEFYVFFLIFTHKQDEIKNLWDKSLAFKVLISPFFSTWALHGAYTGKLHSEQWV